MNNQAILEGLLFINGELGVTNAQASLVLNCEEAECEDIFQKIAVSKLEKTSGVRLLKQGDVYKFATKVEHFPAYVSYFKQESHFSMSRAMLEVISIIAYRQPTTRAGIEDVRGVNSDGIVKKLLLLDLVCEAGVEETPGRPMLFATTQTFLDYFDLESLSDLPELKEFTENEVLEEVELFMTKYTEQSDE